MQERQCTFRSSTLLLAFPCVREYGSHGAGAVSILVTKNADEAKQARKEAAALPLNDYDDLNVEEVQEKIQGLSNDDIETLLDYEKNRANRKTLVATLESRF